MAPLRASGCCPRRYIIAHQDSASKALTDHPWFQECGFINFVDITDAIRAKDDVLNRLGGSIGQANGQTVRIGFGKADSAPATPSGPNSGGTHSSHFLANSNPSLSARDGVSRSSSGDGGMDAQLQSTPTRALWIGSIPSTTTPATILSVFSPFGPIESARVLTHKNCGFGTFHIGFRNRRLLLIMLSAHQSTSNDSTMLFAHARLSMAAMFSAVMLGPSALDSPGFP